MSSQCDNLYKYITEASHPIYLYVYAKMCVVYMWCKHCKYFCVSIFNFIIKFERAKEKNIRPHPPFNAMEILFTLHTPWALPFSVYFIYYGILYCVQLKFFLSIEPRIIIHNIICVQITYINIRSYSVHSQFTI